MEGSGNCPVEVLTQYLYGGPDENMNKLPNTTLSSFQLLLKNTEINFCPFYILSVVLN
jgi:hypothetical protein